MGFTKRSSGTAVNILSVNTFLPCPPRRGMDVIYLNLLKMQAEEHDVTVVCLARNDAAPQDLAALQSLCKRVVVIKPRNASSVVSKVWRRALYSLLSVLLWRPRCTFYAAPAELQQAIQQLTTEQRFDLVEIHHSTSGALRRCLDRVPTALYLYDLHHRAKARSAQLKRGVKALAEWCVVSQFRRFESSLLPQFDLLLLGQEQDKAEVEKIVGAGPTVGLMPNVIDTAAVAPVRDVEIVPRSAVFVGAMTHAANVDAVLYFADAVWPLIRQQVPDAQWWIVGGRPPQAIRDLDGRDGMRVHADVPDVRPFIATATVYIAPLRIGSGVKVKIMEAMAMGKAIVASPVASEGMGLIAGEELQVVEPGPEFAAAVIALWVNPRQRISLESRARAAAEKLFSFSAGNKVLGSVYPKINERHARQS